MTTIRYDPSVFDNLNNKDFIDKEELFQKEEWKVLLKLAPILNQKMTKMSQIKSSYSSRNSNYHSKPTVEYGNIDDSEENGEDSDFQVVRSKSKAKTTNLKPQLPNNYVTKMRKQQQPIQKGKSNNRNVIREITIVLNGVTDTNVEDVSSSILALFKENESFPNLKELFIEQMFEISCSQFIYANSYATILHNLRSELNIDSVKLHIEKRIAYISTLQCTEGCISFMNKLNVTSFGSFLSNLFLFDHFKINYKDYFDKCVAKYKLNDDEEKSSLIIDFIIAFFTSNEKKKFVVQQFKEFIGTSIQPLWTNNPKKSDKIKLYSVKDLYDIAL